MTIQLGRADCGHYDIAARKEWLVTNGIGGFAAGTLSGAHTRRYHGLLLAALNPPLGRTMLVSKLDVTARYQDAEYPLFANRFTDGTVDPHGYQFLESFRLDGLIPVWHYIMADARLEQRVWMAYGQNTTYITYHLSQGTGPVTLEIDPLCTYRDYHSHSLGGWSLNVEPIAGGFRIRAFDDAHPYSVVADRGEFHPDTTWYWNFNHERESERGLDSREDLLRPGRFHITLTPGEIVTIICSTEPVTPHAGLDALEQERRRQADLLYSIPPDEPTWIRHLALAADQFIVERSLDDGTAGATVIAGYPWFSDWGRDTMIALPGLTLSTGRPDLAAIILRTFARYVDQGMLPNRFPDAGETPEYNTVDATLWYFHAVYQYWQSTDDMSLIQDLYPILADIIDWHRRGTRYDIHVADDGLLFAGTSGVQLTWMDAKVGNWVVTPRIGKAVEINALWHNALRIMAELAQATGQPEATFEDYTSEAERVAETFRQRFWYEAGGYLYDVVDGPEGELSPDGRRSDTSLRPNQIFAVSLPFKLLTDAQAKAVVDTCARELWTSYGLRSLSSTAPDYIGRYGGMPETRDGAYHQGTVWVWLLGPFATAHYRVYGDAAQAKAFLAAVANHLSDGCLGSISEIFNGNPPHSPRGCFAQAWSVAELLRAWREATNSE
ncbi:MAG: glycogen debranching enzyme family protein [Anaerolineae bacterium]|nr:glycogen debranching enzyme family protein [Anaerolineae bacterium]